MGKLIFPPMDPVKFEAKLAAWNARGPRLPKAPRWRKKYAPEVHTKHVKRMIAEQAARVLRIKSVPMYEE